MGAFISRFVGDSNDAVDQRPPNANSASAEIGNEKPTQRSTSARQSREPHKQRPVAQTAEKPEKRETQKIYKTTLEAKIEPVPPIVEAEEAKPTYYESDSSLTLPAFSERLFEIEEAVIKIQAGIRGYLVRKRLKELEDIQQSVTPIVPPPPNFNDTVSDSALNIENQEEAVSKYIQLVNETNEEFQQSLRTDYYSPSEEEIEATKRKIGAEEAAVKIQSAFRGHLCRKQVAEDKKKDIFIDSNITSDLSNDELIQNALNIANDKVAVTSKIPTSPTEPNVSTSAQNKVEDLIVFVEEKQTESVKIVVDDSPLELEQTTEDEAAVKIQAAFRGYQVRKSISREASPVRQKIEMNLIPENNQPLESSSLTQTPDLTIPTIERESINVLDQLENDLLLQLDDENDLSVDGNNLLEDYSLAQSENIVLTSNIEFQTPELHDTKDENIQNSILRECVPEVFSETETSHAQNTNSASTALSEIASIMKGNLEELASSIHLKTPQTTESTNEELKTVASEVETAVNTSKKEIFQPDVFSDVILTSLPEESFCVHEFIDESKPCLQFETPKSPINTSEPQMLLQEDNGSETSSKAHTCHQLHSGKAEPTLTANIGELKQSNNEVVKVIPKSKAVEKAEAIPEESTVAKKFIEESKCQDRDKKDIKSDVHETKPIVSNLESTSSEVIVPQFTENAFVANNDDNSAMRVQKEMNSQVEIVSCESLPKSMETSQSDSNAKSIEAKNSEDVLRKKWGFENEDTVVEISYSPESKSETHESLDKSTVETLFSECKKTEYVTAANDDNLLMETDAIENDKQIKTNVVNPEVAPKPDVISDIKETVVDVKEAQLIPEMAQSFQQLCDVESENRVEGACKDEKLSISVIEAPTVSLVLESPDDDFNSPPIASGFRNVPPGTVVDTLVTDDDCNSPPSAGGRRNVPAGTTVDTTVTDEHSEFLSLGVPRREIRSQSPNPFGRRRKRGKKHQKQ